MVDAPPQSRCQLAWLKQHRFITFLSVDSSPWLTEGGKPGNKIKNKNGTYDYGAFQINTIWANKLASDLA